MLRKELFRCLTPENANSLYDTCLQGIMVVCIKTNLQSKMMNKITIR